MVFEDLIDYQEELMLGCQGNFAVYNIEIQIAQQSN